MTRLFRTVAVTACALVVVLALAGSWLRPEPEPGERWICFSERCHDLAVQAGAEPVAAAEADR